MKTFLEKNGIAVLSAILFVLAVLILIYVPDTRLWGLKETVVTSFFTISIWESRKVVVKVLTWLWLQKIQPLLKK